MELTKVEVGQSFKLFGGSKMAGTTGAVFEALEEQQGYMFSIYLPNMSGREKNLLRRATLNARVIKEGSHVLAMIRFDNEPLMFEIEFNPTLYDDNRAMQLVLDNHMVTFIGIEATTNIVKTIRTANMPKRLKQIWTTAWGTAMEIENYTEKYKAWVNELYKQPMLKLWSMGEPVGYFGENY